MLRFCFTKIIVAIVILVEVQNRNSQIAFPTNWIVSRIYIQPTFLTSPQDSILTWPLTSLNVTNFIGLPNAYLSLAGMDWYYKNNIQFQFYLINITITIANIHYKIDKIEGLDLNIMIFDSLSYNFPSQNVEGVINALTGTDRRITIPGHENYELAYITAFKCNIFVNQPIILSYSRLVNAISGNIQLNITFNSSQISVERAKFLLITMSHGQQSPLLFTNNYFYCQSLLTIENAIINSQMLSTYGTTLVNSKNIFYGLHFITKISRDSSLTNIAVANVTNISQVRYTQFLASIFKVFYKKCDNTYRYFDVESQTCISSCSTGHYLDQYLACHSCSDVCQNCVKNLDNCTSCVDYFTLLSNDTQTINNTCICLKLYTASNNTCNPCTNAIDLIYCQYCSDQFTCTKCMESFTLITDPVSGTKKICICNGQAVLIGPNKWGCILSTVTQVCPLTAYVDKLSCKCPFNTTFINQSCQPPA